MKKISIILFLSFQLLSANFDAQVNRIANKNNISKIDAEKILSTTAQMIHEVQTGFSLIADSSYNYYSKVGEYGYISDVLTYFKSSHSLIDISSRRGHNRQVVHSKPVGNYLNRLAKMSKDGKKTVTLEFDTEKGIHIDDTYIRHGYLEVLASVHQLFESCRDTHDGKKCYSDVTKKTFVLKAQKVRNKLEMYIDSIKVQETYSMDYYKSTIR